MNLRTNLFERSLAFSSYLAIALSTRSHTMFDVGFSIKELGMTDEAHGLDRGPTATFF
ncbi:hypothetical protein [Phormidium nigroviride]|uniref:hypothetical protein n=1 Tax=Phormidium nigroviride TaxID=482564 RepID=UPI0002D46168|nr:hypothetical protein [Oscillatoria nigro-viridis]